MSVSASLLALMLSSTALDHQSDVEQPTTTHQLSLVEDVALLGPPLPLDKSVILAPFDPNRILTQQDQPKTVTIATLPYAMQFQADRDVTAPLEPISPDEIFPQTNGITDAADPRPDPAQPQNENEIVVTAGTTDAIESVSLQTFDIAQDLDIALVRPVAMAYQDALPKPVRSGLRNFFRNLSEPIVALNYLLQLKPGKAIETAGRFVINTGLGFGGLIDIAEKPGINLPYRSNGFANTLGYYGVKPGRYMYLPLVGSTTVRDLFGDTLDMVLTPLAYGSPVNKPYFGLTAGVVDTLEDRVEIDETLEQMRDEEPIPYYSMRDYYLKMRQAEIDALKGKTVDFDIKKNKAMTSDHKD